MHQRHRDQSNARERNFNNPSQRYRRLTANCPLFHCGWSSEDFESTNVFHFKGKAKIIMYMIQAFCNCWHK